MKQKRIWIILLITASLIGYLTIQNFASDAGKKNASPPTPSTTLNANIEAVTVTQTFTPPPAESSTAEPCGYMWAAQNLPDLSVKLDKAIRALNLKASVRAEAFGEDCVHTDGSRNFLAMETDFYIQLRVDDLTNEEALGNWMSQAMAVIEQISPEEIHGPQPGFVEFRFTKSDTEQVNVRVPIRDYREKAGGKSGAELFKLFYIPPVNST